LSQLIYFSPVEWESFAQRPHKFVEWFQTRHGGNVLWIEPYPTRLPNLRDLLSRRPSHQAKQKKEVPPWIQVVRPGGYPIEPLPFGALVNRFASWRKVKEKIRSFVERADPLIVVGKPSQLAIDILKKYPGCRSAYDAMDDFPSFYRGISQISMRKREDELVGLVDSVWTSSTALYHRWKPRHGAVRLVRNALDDSRLPAVMRAREVDGRKVFGYVGTVARWFDWDWIAALAEARLRDEVRIIGPIIGTEKPPLPANVVFMPQCEHAEAIQKMAQFDVGLIPFRRTPLTESVDPIKYYEYRALGLPVISTDFGEMSHRRNETGVFVGGKESVEKLAGLAIAHFDPKYFRHLFISSNSWTTRFGNLELVTSGDVQGARKNTEQA